MLHPRPKESLYSVCKACMGALEKACIHGNSGESVHGNTVKNMSNAAKIGSSARATLLFQQRQDDVPQSACLYANKH